VKRSLAWLGLLPLAACAAEPEFPLGEGTYRFAHRFAEHPSMPSIELEATIRDGRIELVNRRASAVFPAGVVTEGMILWHPRSGQWIVAQDEASRDAPEAGGCSDGPEAIDPVARIYWTC